MKKHILIIDDEEGIRKVYKKIIYTFGSTVFEVVEASNATEATNHMIRNQVDVIILDIKMPMVDGRTMYDVIQEYNPKIKVIVASVYPIEQQRQMIPRAMDYFDKSHGPIKLLEKVTKTFFV